MVGFTCSGLLDRGMQCVGGLPVIVTVARFLFRGGRKGGDSHEVCSVSDPHLSLWVAEGVIGLLDTVSCEPGSCSYPCLPCFEEWCWVVCIGCCGTGV